MKHNLFKEVVFIFCFLSVEFSFCANVPAMLWNFKGNALTFQPISAFAVNNKNFIDNVLKETLNGKSTSLLVLLLDKMSLEDFSTVQSTDYINSTIHVLETFLEQHPHMLLPIVKNPIKQLYNKKCGLEEIHIDKNTAYSELRSSLSSAVNEVCVTVVHFHGAGDEQTSSSVKSLLHSSVPSTKENVIGMVTAKKSSWEDNQSEQRRSRSLLQVEEEDHHLINVSDCIMMYVQNITVEIGDNETIVLQLPPNTDGTNCENLTSILNMSFEADEIDIKFAFERQYGTWFLNETVFRRKLEEVYLKVENLEAPVGFSFSCGNLVLTTKNSTLDIRVTMDRFQIQPFEVNGPFAPSFDCVTFFTLPIWMGLFVIILFTIILGSGIYALFSVKTMDRFDDPKGKTISVPTSE